MEIETVIWLILVLLAAKYTRADGSLVSHIWIGITGVRVVGTMAFALRYVVTRNPAIDAQRAAALLLVNVVTVALGFAAFFRALPATAWLDHPPTTGWQFAYTSWTTMLTMGSGLGPKDAAAGFLVMAELGCGLVLIAVTLGTVLQAIHFDLPPEAQG